MRYVILRVSFLRLPTENKIYKRCGLDQFLLKVGVFVPDNLLKALCKQKKNEIEQYNYFGKLCSQIR